MPELRQRLPRQRDAGYIKWVQQQPCVICGMWPVQAAHVSFADITIGKEHRGKGEKTHDKWVLPLCFPHHHEQTLFPSGEMAWWYGCQKKEPHKLCEEHYLNYRDETGATEPEVQRYKEKRKRTKKKQQTTRKILNRKAAWPTRKFQTKKRATQ